MLTLANVNTTQAKTYYKRENYYSQEDAQANSQWQGQGAAQFDLHGAIEDLDAYENIVNGLSPDGKTQLRQKQKHQDKKERAGIDLTFSAPKSVSIACLVGGDSRLEEAHRNAVTRTIDLIEKRYAETRINGQRVKTGNSIVAKWHHDTSRELDPHLHTHCLVMNCTQSPDGKWRSLSNEEFYRYKILLGQIYRNELALECRKLGYEIQPHPQELFEIKGYTREQIEAFSKRHEQLVEYLKRREIDVNTESKVWAWRRTRAKKNHEIDREQMRPYWHEEADMYGIVHPTPTYEIQGVPEEVVALQLATAVQAGIEHCCERKVAFKAEEIERFVTTEVKPFSIKQLEVAIANHPELISTYDGRHTTETALARELETIKIMQNGKGRLGALAHPELVENYLHTTTLNRGQRQAVTLAATTIDAFILWHGVAGAGKTHALRELKQLTEALKGVSGSYSIKAFSPNAEPAKVLGAQLGIEAHTVASLLHSKPPEQVQPNSIWIVDEAGLLSAKDAHAFMQRAVHEQARVIFVGDTRQFSAVEAGNPLKSLLQGEIQVAYLDEAIRQRDALAPVKKAVNLAASGEIAAAIEQLEQAERIEIEPDAQKRASAIAQKYMALSPQQRQQTLVLTGTHKERLAITKAIREQMKLESSIGDEVKATQLLAKDLTSVQARYTHHYNVGDVIVPIREYRRFRLHKSMPYRVEAIAGDKLLLSDLAGNQLTVDPMKFRKSVYSPQDVEIAVGDRLKWTKNDKQLCRRNGQEFVVTGIEGQTATIEYANGKQEKIAIQQPLHLDHALVSTIYSSQGKTAQRVLISSTADLTLSQESFYVAISRAKHDVQIWAEDKMFLLERSRQSQAQSTVLQLLSTPRPLLLHQQAIARNATATKIPAADCNNVAISEIESPEAPQTPTAKNRPTQQTEKEQQLIVTKLDTQQLVKRQKIIQPQEQIDDTNIESDRAGRTDGNRNSNRSGDRSTDSYRRPVGSEQYKIVREDRPVGEQQHATEREDSTAGNNTERECKRIESQSNAVLEAISRYLELQEVKQLGADIEKLDRNLTASRFRGQRAATLSGAVERQNFRSNDATKDRASVREQEPSDERRISEELINAIAQYLETESLDSSTISSSLENIAKDLHDQTRAWDGLVQLLQTAVAAPALELEALQHTAANAIALYVEESSIESSGVIEALQSVTQQLCQYQQSTTQSLEAIVDYVEDRTNETVAAAEELTQVERQQITLYCVEAIANHVEETTVDSGVAQHMDSFRQQLIQLQTESFGWVKKLEVVVFEQVERLKALSAQRDREISTEAIEALTNYIQEVAVETALNSSALQTITNQLVQLTSPIPSASIKQLETDATERQSPSPTQTLIETNNLAIEAIADYQERDAIDPTEVVRETECLMQQIPSNSSRLSQQLRQIETAIEQSYQLSQVEQAMSQKTIDSSHSKSIPGLDYCRVNDRWVRANKATSQFDRLFSTASSSRENADYYRELPLEEVAECLGLERDRYDKHKWRNEGQIISINNQKFYDHLEEKGGYGAIDLVMHVQQRNFKQALDWLSNGATSLPLPQQHAPRPKVKAKPKEFHAPVPDESKWVEVKEYLVGQRGLPAALVERLHDSGKLYAAGVEREILEKLRAQGYSHPEQITNAVFLRSNNSGEITGASIRGISAGISFKGLATGSHRNQGWFTFTQGQGDLQRIVLVESPIDAISAAALSQAKSGKTRFIALDGTGAIPIDYLRQQQAASVEVIAGHDTDRAGETMAWKVAAQLPSIARATPKGKDWNDQLLGKCEVAPNPQEWKQVARSLGKSEAYIGRVIAVTKSGQSLGGQATEAMQHDLGAYSQTSAQLWQWHGAAKALGKSDTYLNRIAQVAIAFHHPTQGVPVPPRAVAIMQQDILAEQELTTTISRSQEQAVERQALLLQSLPEQSQNGRSLQLPPQQLWQHYSQNCTAPNPVSQLLEVARAAWQQGVPETQIREILRTSSYMKQFEEKGVKQLVDKAIGKVKRESQMSQEPVQQQQHRQQYQVNQL